MKKIRIMEIFFFLSILLFITSCGKSKEAGNSFKVKVKGTPEVIRAGKNIVLKTGDSVFEKDTINTTAASEIDLIVGADDNIRIKPNSAFSIDSIEEGKKVNVKLNSGKMVAKLNTFKAKNIHFTVSSPTSVCGVRGTQFSLSSNSGEDEVNVLKGEVKVKNIEVNDELSVTENQSTIIRPGRAPLKPAQILESVKPLLSLEVATMRPDLTMSAVRTTVAVFDLKTYQRSIEYFQVNNSRLPESIREFGMSEYDVWGTPLVYYLKDDGYVLFSAGADMIVGTADDIQLEK